MMKKLLYLLLVVPLLFLLISCDEGKSKEQKEFEKSLNVFAQLDEDYLAEHGIRMETESTTSSDSDSITTKTVAEFYKNSYVLKRTGSYSDNEYCVLTFKKNDIIIDRLSRYSSDAKEDGKIYNYGDVTLYEMDEDSIGYNESYNMIMNSYGNYLKVKDFEKVENGYILKKPVSYTLFKDYTVHLDEYTIELDDGRISSAYYEATIDMYDESFFVTCSINVDYDATIDTYIQEAVKEVK